MASPVKLVGDASRYRTWLKASSTHSDSANWPRNDVQPSNRWNGTLRLYFVGRLIVARKIACNCMPIYVIVLHRVVCNRSRNKSKRKKQLR